MKVKFCCDSGANIYSRREDILDTEEDLGIPDEEWAAMSDDEKFEVLKEWAYDRLEMWYEELE